MKLIDKAALVAEIEKLMGNPELIEDWRYRVKMEEKNELLKSIINIINTFKVKEENLEKNMKVYRIQCNTVDEDGTSYSFLPGIYISSEIAEKHKPEDYEWPWEEVTYEVVEQEIIEE